MGGGGAAAAAVFAATTASFFFRRAASAARRALISFSSALICARSSDPPDCILLRNGATVPCGGAVMFRPSSWARADSSSLLLTVSTLRCIVSKGVRRGEVLRTSSRVPSAVAPCCAFARRELYSVFCDGVSSEAASIFWNHTMETLSAPFTPLATHSASASAFHAFLRAWFSWYLLRPAVPRDGDLCCPSGSPSGGARGAAGTSAGESFVSISDAGASVFGAGACAPSMICCRPMRFLGGILSCAAVRRYMYAVFGLHDKKVWRANPTPWGGCVPTA